MEEGAYLGVVADAHQRRAGFRHPCKKHRRAVCYPHQKGDSRLIRNKSVTGKRYILQSALPGIFAGYIPDDI